MTMALIPIGYLMYQFTGPGNYEHKYLTRVINSYDGYRKDAAHIAALHTDALEQAAADRNLFANTQRAQNVTLRFPEYVQISLPIPSARHHETQFIQHEYEENAMMPQHTRERHTKRIGRLTKFCRQDPQHWSSSQRARRPLRRHVTSHCQVREGGLRGQRKEVAADQGQRCPQRAPLQGPPSHWRRDRVDVDIPCQQANSCFPFVSL
jgi:transcriptional regulator of acetoin/glycerol metabolism